MKRETELEMAQRHVRQGEARVAAQRELVEELRRDGHDMTQAEKLLVTFQTTLASHRRALDIVTRESQRKL
jgi:hypothetical protein